MSLSEQLFQKASKIIPGGVNSPVRAFKGVGGTPLFIKQGKGAHLIDVDDNAYIDYIGSWGALILGHAHPRVVQAVSHTLQHGMSFGAPTPLEIELAQAIIDCMPTIEKIRLVSSGTEATMTAIRLARGYTTRTKIIKFNGCYHGHSDSLLAKAGSGLLTLGIPASPGIPADLAQHTLTAEFNAPDQVEDLFKHHPDDIAAIILEPIAGNMGLVLPKAGFLKGLRELCDRYGAVLIFDEVMTGFRVALGGAQALYDIKPDLTTLGKVIGGGMPVGAVGGKAEIMSHLAPEGSVYQAGTLSGHPLAMAAGIATLHEIRQAGFYDRLQDKASQLVEALSSVAAGLHIPFTAYSIGGMFGFFFPTDASRPIHTYHDVAASNAPLFKAFFHGMLQQGVYFAPSLFEAGFISSAHQTSDIEKTREAAEVVLDALV